MAYKTLIFGTDDLFNTLKPFYANAVDRGILEIVAYAFFDHNGPHFFTPDGKSTDSDSMDLDLAIISSWSGFYNRMKYLEACGFPRKQIIEGCVFFNTPRLDFSRLLKEGVAYSRLETNFFSDTDSNSQLVIGSIYPRVYQTLDGKLTLTFGTKGFIASSIIEGQGLISVGKYTTISWEETFKLGVNNAHDYRKIFTTHPGYFGWEPPAEFLPRQDPCKILIGNDVLIGRGCILKCTNPNKPLVIGDGAFIATDSVVVKSVPPYAIVGGNPAQIIKYRFPPDVIEALLRIKWWDWNIDKIHDNFSQFNDIEKFISLHDK